MRPPPTGGNSSCPIAVLRKPSVVWIWFCRYDQEWSVSLSSWMLSSKLGKLTLEGYMHFFFCLWSIAQKSIRSKDTIPKHVQSKYPPIRVINSDLQRKNGQGILNPKVWIYQPSSEYQKNVEACEFSFPDKCRNLVKTPWDNSGVNKAKLGLAHYLFAKPPQLVRNWSWIKLGFGQRVKVVDRFLRLSKHTKLCFCYWIQVLALFDKKTEWHTHIDTNSILI